MDNAIGLAKRIMRDRNSVRIIGGVSEALQGKTPRDIDLYCSDSISIMDQYLSELLGDRYFRMISPYNIIQIFLINSKNVELIDILCGLKSLRVKNYYPISEQLTEDYLSNYDHQHADFRINSALYYFKNITKTYLCNDQDRIKNKFEKLRFLESKIYNFSRGYEKITISNNLLTRANAFLSAIVQKCQNIYHTNVSNRYHTDVVGAVKFIEIANFNVNSLDFAADLVNYHVPYRMSRKFFIFELPISQLKVCIRERNMFTPLYVKAFRRSDLNRIMDKIGDFYEEPLDKR